MGLFNKGLKTQVAYPEIQKLLKNLDLIGLPKLEERTEENYKIELGDDEIATMEYCKEFKLFDFHITPLKDETKITKLNIELDLIISYDDNKVSPDHISVSGTIEIALKKNASYRTNITLHDNNLSFKAIELQSLVPTFVNDTYLYWIWKKRVTL